MTRESRLATRHASDGSSRTARDGRMTRRQLLTQAVAGVGSAAALQEVLGRRGGAQPTGRASELVVAQSSDIGRLDPHLSVTNADLSVTLNVHDTLVARRHDSRLYPGLATTWNLKEPTVWEFKLRPGVKFHSGDPFTAHDVRFSIERAYDPRARTVVATVFGTVNRVEVIDPLTVLVHTKRPDPLLPARLSYLGAQILSKHYADDVGSEGLNARPIGTGPVRFVEWIKGDRVVLERVPDHWSGATAPSRVILRPIPETGPRVAALLKGEVDIITNLPPDHIQPVARHPATKVEEILYAGLYVLVVDSRRPPLGEPKIKQALSLALDREAIVRDLWSNRGVIPNGPIPRGDNHYDDQLPPLRHDPGLARQRLREAGYKGETIVLETSAGRIINELAMSEAAVAMWRDVGLNVRLEVIEPAVVMQRLREQSFKGLRWAPPASTLADPDGMMWRLLGPGGAQATWRHARFDELGQAAQQSLDESFRDRAYREMTTILLEHLPWIPVLQPIEAYGLQRTVEWKPYPLPQIDLRASNLRLLRA